MDRAPLDGPGTLRAQSTSSTSCCGRLVFNPATNWIDRKAFQALACWTQIDILLGIVSKSFFSKYTPITPPAKCARGISHVGCDPQRLTGNEVLIRAILAIGDHGLRL